MIVNELIGNFGTDEGIYESVREFADRNLAPDGRIVPERLRTWLVPVEYGGDFHGVFRANDAGLDLSAALSIPYRAKATLHTLRETPKRLAPPAPVEAVEFSRDMPERRIEPCGLGPGLAIVACASQGDHGRVLLSADPSA